MNKMIRVYDVDPTSDRQRQQHKLNGQIQHSAVLPHHEQNNVNDERSDEIEIKHVLFL
jgi:hypothetical protein